MITQSVEKRFWEKVDKRGPDECWPWIGRAMARGYGKIHIPGRNMARANRVSYAIANNCDIPDPSVFVRHKCDNPRCVNPEHLETGSPQDNVNDMMERKRHPPSNKTHCRHGHPLDGIKNDGGRFCITCKNEYARRYRFRVKAIKSGSDWQGISTAPKQGTFLLYGGGHFMVGSWSEVNGWNDGAARLNQTHFTHWTNLPGAPA